MPQPHALLVGLLPAPGSFVTGMICVIFDATSCSVISFCETSLTNTSPPMTSPAWTTCISSLCTTTAMLFLLRTAADRHRSDIPELIEFGRDAQPFNLFRRRSFGPSSTGSSSALTSDCGSSSKGSAEGGAARLCGPRERPRRGASWAPQPVRPEEADSRKCCAAWRTSLHVAP